MIHELAGHIKYPNTARFKDYRKMFDEVGSKLDGVVISTPDHAHFHPAHAAMLGLHVYLNHWPTMSGRRTLTNLTREKKLATQLGAQRHVMENMYRVVELIQSDAIGKVKEVHCWVGGSRGMPAMPTDRPRSLITSIMIYGWACMYPHHPTHCPYGWRFWWDYGTGETEIGVAIFWISLSGHWD